MVPRDRPPQFSSNCKHRLTLGVRAVTKADPHDIRKPRYDRHNCNDLSGGAFLREDADARPLGGGGGGGGARIGGGGGGGFGGGRAMSVAPRIGGSGIGVRSFSAPRIGG